MERQRAAVEVTTDEEPEEASERRVEAGGVRDRRATNEMHRKSKGINKQSGRQTF